MLTQPMIEEIQTSLLGAGKNIAITIIVLLLVAIIVKVLHYVIEKVLDKKSLVPGRPVDPLKTKTLKSLLKSVVSYTLYLFALAYIVTLYMGPIGFTLAGVGGVALGFGAQSFIKDILSGLFILFEDKFKIGEFITVGPKSGFVEEIGIRSTVLRDFNGDMHILPNGNIQEITNVSRGERRFLVDVTVAADQSIEKALEVMNLIAEKFKASHAELLEGPNVMGVVNIRDIGATLRIQGKANYELHWLYENELRRDILKAFSDEGIKTGINIYPEGGTLR